MPDSIVMHDFYIALLCLSVDGKLIFDSQPSMKYRQHENNVVGVTHGLVSTIKNRLKAITQKENVSIAEQADVILSLYKEEISTDYKDWLQKIAVYRESFVSKICLSCSRKTKYMNLNMGLKLRLSILLGNR